MLIQSQAGTFQKEDIYSTNLEKNIGTIHDIFQKIYNINTEEENKKKNIDTFFLKKMKKFLI